MESPSIVMEGNHSVAPEHSFPYDQIATHNTATSQALRSPIRSHDAARESRNRESKQEDEVQHSAGEHTEGHDTGHVASESDVHTVEAQRIILEGIEDATVMVGKTQYHRTKCYQRRWIVACLALCAFGFAGAVVVVMVVLFSHTTPPTPAPTSLTPLGIACNFLSIPNVTRCRSTVKFDAYNDDDTTTGSTIPTEIGLLTQLTYLGFYSNQLTSTIPSEIGLLTQLTWLGFYFNSLTSSIPTEIGLLTQLTLLAFYNNQLTPQFQARSDA
ncbi:hypothetical protein MHU86_9227 [Fragilaria crotonensis]|nr:hypothetical protein MHU86_9227 [Fragilaria crotonensis]